MNTKLTKREERGELQRSERCDVCHVDRQGGQETERQWEGAHLRLALEALASIEKASLGSWLAKGLTGIVAGDSGRSSGELLPL